MDEDPALAGFSRFWLPIRATKCAFEARPGQLMPSWMSAAVGLQGRQVALRLGLYRKESLDLDEEIGVGDAAHSVPLDPTAQDSEAMKETTDRDAR